MLECSFELNNKKPMSTFVVGALSILPAFSGNKKHLNKRSSACIAFAGPIPPGIYSIFDREIGGLFGSLRNLFSDHSDWFALYANDGKIDDEVLCERIKRGGFRLHPKVSLGISEGCITIEKRSDWHHLRSVLKSVKKIAIPGTTLQAYGKVTVR